MVAKQNFPERIKSNHWVQVTVLSFITLACWFLYISLEQGRSDIYILNKGLAINALFLTGSSMLLASFVYFFKKLQRQIIYRVNLGVVGFFYGLVHASASLYFYLLDPNSPLPNYKLDMQWPFFGGAVVPNLVAFAFGVLADIIFAVMALVSLKFFIVKLGGVRWRKFLRYAGYSALVLVLAHFLIKNYYIWVSPELWGPVPPLNLLLWLWGVSILALRLALWRSLATKSKVQGVSGRINPGTNSESPV